MTKTTTNQQNTVPCTQQLEVKSTWNIKSTQIEKQFNAHS